MAVTAAQLQQLYLAYFGRPADPSGIAFYTSSNIDIWGVAAAFGASPESQALYGSGFSASVINNIYNNLFNRDAEPAGLLYWTQQVAAGFLTPAGAAYGILLGAQNADKTTINNKLAVSATFTAHLDTTQEILAYQGDAAAAAARTFLKGVTSDAATVTTATANVDNAILTIDTVGGLPGQNAVLTTGVDNYVGTSANDTITGVIGGTASQNTMTALDTIDGGQGNDTLTIDDLTGGTALPGGITVSNVEKIVFNSAGAVTADVSGYSATSISTANINGAVTLTASSSQGVTVVDTAAAMVTVTGGASQNVTTAGGETLSKATGAISVTDTTGTVASTINGGTNVAVAITNSTKAGSGTLTIGGVTAPTGTISVTDTVTGNKAADTAAGAITITGGTVVSVTEVGTQALDTAPAAGASTANHTLTESAITVTGKSTTTTVTVAQTPDNAVAPSTTAKAGAVEVDTVTFPAGGLAQGASVTLGGLTFTNNSGATITTAQVAAAFANLSAGSLGGTSQLGFYSGAFSGSYTTGAVSATSTVTATETKNGAGPIGNTGLTVTATQTGGAATKAVAGNGGITAGVVQIADATAGTGAGTITNVAIDGWGTAAGPVLSYVKSDALTTLVLADSDNSLDVYNKGATTLALTVNNLGVNAVGTINLDKLAATYTTLNLATTGNDSAAMITAAAVTALNVSGTNAIDLSSSTLTNLKTVAVTGSAGLTIASGANVTDVNASGTSGDVTVSNFDATLATYEGGSGSDKLTVIGNVSKAISLGAGNDTITLSSAAAAITGSVDGGAGTDTLVMDAALAATDSASSVFASKVTGFEHLTLTGATASATDVAQLGGFTYVTDKTTAAQTINNMASGGTIVLTATGDADTVAVTGAKASTADTLNIVLSKAGALTGAAVTAANVETITIAANDTTAKVVAGTNTDSMTLTDTAATSITVTGNANLTLTSANTKVALVDASGMTAGLTYTTAGTTAEMVKGGASANTLTAAAGTQADTLVGGAGSDVLHSNGGLDVLTGGASSDTFWISPSANVNSYSTVTDAAAGDLIEFNAVAGAAATPTFSSTKITLASTAVFQDFANAAVNAGAANGANGYITWFQYGGDTYVVESAHNATTTHDFQNGVDVIVKLAGLHDLSTAALNTTAGGAGVAFLQLNS